MRNHHNGTFIKSSNVHMYMSVNIHIYVYIYIHADFRIYNNGNLRQITITYDLC